jgi:hypothetical protein
VRKGPILVILGFLSLAGDRSLNAAPVLQFYLEGRVCGEATNTRLAAPPKCSSRLPLHLLAIESASGLVGGGGAENITMAVAYSEEDLGLVISLQPVQVGGDRLGRFRGLVDPSVPIMPIGNLRVRTNGGRGALASRGVLTWGARPVLDGGISLAADGLFGLGVVWQEVSLLHLALWDCPIDEFPGPLPRQLLPATGRINVCRVCVSGGSGATTECPLSGATGGRGEIAAGWNDPDLQVFLAPEPAAFFVWGLLGLTFAGSAWMYQYLARWRALEAEDLALALVPAGSCARPIEERPSELSRPARGESPSHELPTWDGGTF